MVEYLEDGEFSAPEDCETGAEAVEEAGEVVNVGPEEDAARGARAQREAKEPLESGGFGAAPEPTGVADLGGGGEEDPGEDGGGDEGHGEGMEGREGPQREGSVVVAAENQDVENEVEEDGENHVSGDGGEEEGPGGSPQLGVAPPEFNDRRMFRQIISYVLNQSHRSRDETQTNGVAVVPVVPPFFFPAFCDLRDCPTNEF